MTNKRKKKTVKVDRKELQKLTKKDMERARKEDSVNVRKKAIEFLNISRRDAKIIDQTMEKFEEQLKILRERKIKSNGAIQILEMLLSDNKE